MNPENIKKYFHGFILVISDKANLEEVTVALVNFVALYASNYAKEGRKIEFIDALANDAKNLVRRADEKRKDMTIQ